MKKSLLLLTCTLCFGGTYLANDSLKTISNKTIKSLEEVTSDVTFSDIKEEKAGLTFKANYDENKIQIIDYDLLLMNNPAVIETIKPTSNTFTNYDKGEFYNIRANYIYKENPKMHYKNVVSEAFFTKLPENLGENLYLDITPYSLKVRLQSDVLKAFKLRITKLKLYSDTDELLQTLEDPNLKFDLEPETFYTVKAEIEGVSNKLKEETKSYTEASVRFKSGREHEEINFFIQESSETAYNLTSDIESTTFDPNSFIFKYKIYHENIVVQEDTTNDFNVKFTNFFPQTEYKLVVDYETKDNKPGPKGHKELTFTTYGDVNNVDLTESKVILHDDGTATFTFNKTITDEIRNIKCDFIKADLCDGERVLETLTEPGEFTNLSNGFIYDIKYYFRVTAGGISKEYSSSIALKTHTNEVNYVEPQLEELFIAPHVLSYKFNYSGFRKPLNSIKVYDHFNNTVANLGTSLKGQVENLIWKNDYYFRFEFIDESIKNQEYTYSYDYHFKNYNAKYAFKDYINVTNITSNSFDVYTKLNINYEDNSDPDLKIKHLVVTRPDGKKQYYETTDNFSLTVKNLIALGTYKIDYTYSYLDEVNKCNKTYTQSREVTLLENTPHPDKFVELTVDIQPGYTNYKVVIDATNPNKVRVTDFTIQRRYKQGVLHLGPILEGTLENTHYNEEYTLTVYYEVTTPEGDFYTRRKEVQIIAR